MEARKHKENEIWCSEIPLAMKAKNEQKKWGEMDLKGSK
jgi:hypothetical protein